METREEVRTVNPEIIYSGDKAAFDSQVATAKEYPRNTRLVVDNMIGTITLSEKIASSCSYAIKRDEKIIKGPSVHLARIIAQEWGNLRFGARTVQVNQEDVVCEGFCWDLEKNTAVQTSIKRSILNSSGQRYSKDMIVVTENAGNAIAMRNAILAVIPKGVIDHVYESAISFITGDLTTEEKLIAKRSQLVKELRDKYTLSDEEILRAVGKQAIEHIGSEEIKILIGFDQAIKDGDSTTKELFKGVSRKPKSKVNQLNMARKNELKNFEVHLKGLKFKKDLSALRKQIVKTGDSEKLGMIDLRFSELFTKPEKSRVKIQKK